MNECGFKDYFQKYTLEDVKRIHNTETVLFILDYIDCKLYQPLMKWFVECVNVECVKKLRTFDIHSNFLHLPDDFHYLCKDVEYAKELVEEFNIPKYGEYGWINFVFSENKDIEDEDDYLYKNVKYYFFDSENKLAINIIMKICEEDNIMNRLCKGLHDDLVIKLINMGKHITFEDVEDLFWAESEIADRGYYYEYTHNVLKHCSEKIKEKAKLDWDMRESLFGSDDDESASDDEK
jgi:hypothetical protein